jgi:hypothetical protein
MRIFPGDRHGLLNHLPKGGTCVEVGVLRGGFSAAILACVRPSKLVLIDLWKQQPREVYDDKANTPDSNQEQILKYVMRRFAREIKRGVVEIRRGYSDAELLKLPAIFNMVYLDANHSEQCVYADLNAAKKVLARNGFILGHDYCEGDDAGHKFGVIPAVTRFLAENEDMHLLLVTDEDYPTYMLVPTWCPDELSRIGLRGV